MPDSFADHQLTVSRELGEMTAELRSIKNAMTTAHKSMEEKLNSSSEQLKAIWQKIDDQKREIHNLRINEIRELQDKNLIFETKVDTINKGSKWTAALISGSIALAANWKKIMGWLF